MDLVALGARIRELRGPMSMGQAAKRAGLTSAYWSAVENATPGKKGDASRPSVPYLRAIADALDADRAELLELAGYEEDAAWDRARTARVARAAGDEDPVLSALNQDPSLSEADRQYAIDLVKRLRQQGS